MNPRILFVDDHEDTRMMLPVLLGAKGYELTTADSLKEGLRLAKSGVFDLYLFDFIFEDGTGRELCEKVREFDRNTPILFFSGSHPVKHQEAITCGAQGFVMKPDFNTLRREIEKMLKRAKVRGTSRRDIRWERRDSLS